MIEKGAKDLTSEKQAFNLLNLVFKFNDYQLIHSLWDPVYSAVPSQMEKAKANFLLIASSSNSLAGVQFLFAPQTDSSFLYSTKDTQGKLPVELASYGFLPTFKLLYEGMKKETTFDFLKPILLKNSIDGESLEVFNFLISYENFSKETLQSVLTPKLIWRAYTKERIEF
jgi:hypothetical protein